MQRRRPDVVLWDADGVLQHAASGWRARLLEVGGGQRLLDDLFAAEKPCLRGERPFSDAVAQVLRRHGIAVPVQVVTAPWARIDVDPDALALADAVRATGIRCYLATNQQDLRRDVMRRDLPYDRHLDGQFYSCELGVAKPDPGFYQAILGSLRIRAGSALLIDDSAPNVAAAADIGMRAALHDPSSGAGGLRKILSVHGIDV